MASGATEAFRVVMERLNEDGTPASAITLGPFATRGAAKGARTREINLWVGWSGYGRTAGRTATGQLQHTASNWQDIDE
jgi:hypothetical protein